MLEKVKASNEASVQRVSSLETKRSDSVSACESVSNNRNRVSSLREEQEVPRRQLSPRPLGSMAHVWKSLSAEECPPSSLPGLAPGGMSGSSQNRPLSSSQEKEASADSYTT